MSKVTVVAKVVAKKDAIGPVKAELLKMIPPTRQEEGCIEYRLHQDNDDPAVFIFYETLASLEHHLSSAHFRNYVAAVESLIVEKTVHKMTEIG